MKTRKKRKLSKTKMRSSLSSMVRMIATWVTCGPSNGIGRWGRSDCEQATWIYTCHGTSGRKACAWRPCRPQRPPGTPYRLRQQKPSEETAPVGWRRVSPASSAPRRGRGRGRKNRPAIALPFFFFLCQRRERRRCGIRETYE